MKKYIVLKEFNLHTLEDVVSSLISEEYSPIGEVSVTMSEGSRYYYQAMLYNGG
jgi:hypothetical protein